MIQSPAGYQGDVRIKRYLDFYQPGYGVAMLSSGVAFSPLSLFANGEQGGWYDPSDLTTMFQDAAGTTAAALESPVGLIRDKSGNGNHLSQSTSTARPVLSARVNVLTGTATLSTQTADMTVVSALGVTSNWVLSFSGSGTVTIGGTGYSSGSNTISLTSTASLSVTVSGTVTNADLRQSNVGSALPSYQRVTTSTDYDTTGFPLYLKFDGTDDFLVSGTISPGSVDKAQVFAGVRRMSDAAWKWLVQYGNPSTQNQSLGITMPDDATIGNTGFYARGTSTVLYSPTGNASPKSLVVASLVDLAGVSKDTTIIPRINGTVSQSGGSGTTSGGGNFGSYAIGIGASTSSPNAQLYSLILRFSATNMDAATIAATETWVNQKTLAY